MEAANEQFTMNRIMEYWMLGIFGTIFCAIGVVANLISLPVFRHKSLISSTSVYLFAQSLADAAYLFFFMLVCVKAAAGPDSSYDKNFIVYVQPALFFLTQAAHYCTTYITVGFTVDRFIAICFPFRKDVFCTTHKAIYSCILIVTLSIIIAIPECFAWKTSIFNHASNNAEKFDFIKLLCLQNELSVNSSNVKHISNGSSSIQPLPECMNLTNAPSDSLIEKGNEVALVEATDFSRSHLYRVYYHLGVYITAMWLAPMLALILLNIRLTLAVRRSVRCASNLGGVAGSSDKNAENRITVMLVAIVTFFLICRTFALINKFPYALSELSSSLYELRFNAIVKMSPIADFLLVLNSSVNIIFYLLFSHKFRKQMSRMLCSLCSQKKRKRKKKGNDLRMLNKQECSLLSSQYERHSSSLNYSST